VDIVCLRDRGQKKSERFGNIHVHRINLQRKRGSKYRYLWEYGFFLSAAFLQMVAHHARKRYDIVHVHNMPDVLVFSALFPKLAGARVLLDLHDLMPELYMTIYSLQADHAMIRVLRLLEKASIGMADLVITPNHSFREQYISRGCPESKIHIVMNSPDEKIFRQNGSPPDDGSGTEKGPFTFMFHGQIFDRQGVETAIEAVHLLRDKIPNFVFLVYGGGKDREKTEKKVEALQLGSLVRFYGQVPVEEIAEALTTCDVGIVPNRMTPFTNLNLPTRIFEYLIMKKPVIAPRTRGVMDYFKEEEIFYFAPDNATDLARVMLAAYQDPEKRRATVEAGFRVFQQYRWENQKSRLVSIVQGLPETPC